MWVACRFGVPKVGEHSQASCGAFKSCPDDDGPNVPCQLLNIQRGTHRYYTGCKYTCRKLVLGPALRDWSSRKIV